jgi:EAL domain-containing protein (putative c-di-GMP-specific phosphodiesterase class I)
VLADAESTHEKLLRRANLAMYAAKRDGGDRVQRFHPEMLTSADSRTELVYDLRSAAAGDQLALHYQPIVDLADGTIWGAEALVRWRHPEQGLLTAAAFIGLAEEAGAMEGIERFSLEEACRVAATWPAIDGRVPNLTVNVSAARLRGRDFAAEVEETLRRHRLPPERLVMEVTESVALDSDSRTAANLRTLRSLGVRLALDDFGTGYSSLSYLARFPVDLLKLGGTFLAGITDIAGQQQLVGGVIQLAGSLGVPVVVEGVERADQVVGLTGLGASLGQGFFLGLPMDADALAERFAAAAGGPRPAAVEVLGEVA